MRNCTCHISGRLYPTDGKNKPDHLVGLRCCGPQRLGLLGLPLTASRRPHNHALDAVRKNCYSVSANLDGETILAFVILEWLHLKRSLNVYPHTLLVQRTELLCILMPPLDPCPETTPVFKAFVFGDRIVKVD